MKIGIKLQCRKCSIGILVAIEREVMQMRSVFVGRMGIENGRLLEIGGCGTAFDLLERTKAKAMRDVY